MSLLRAILRGLKDLYDQFFAMAKFSLLWWLCVLTIVASAPATVTLFSMADPRRFVSTPELSDAVEVFRTAWKRGWGIALLTGPFLAALIWNIIYFTGSGHTLAVVVPLWITMVVILFVFAFYAFATAGTMESGVRNALRGAAFVLVRRPFASIVMSFFLATLMFVMTLLVLPSLFIGPALVALIVNRFTLDTFGIPVIDPNAPTIERTDERSRGIEHDRGFFDRMRGSGQRR